VQALFFNGYFAIFQRLFSDFLTASLNSQIAVRCGAVVPGAFERFTNQ